MDQPEIPDALPGTVVFGAHVVVFPGDDHTCRLYLDLTDAEGIYRPALRLHSEQPTLTQPGPWTLARDVITSVHELLTQALVEYWPTF